MTGRLSWEFAPVSVSRASPAVGRQLYAAVWDSSAGHVLIGAPTFEDLEMQWIRITGKALDSDVVQRVSVIESRDEDAEAGQ